MWEIDLEELVDIVTDAIAFIFENFEITYHGYHVNLGVLFISILSIYGLINIFFGKSWDDDGDNGDGSDI